MRLKRVAMTFWRDVRLVLLLPRQKLFIELYILPIFAVAQYTLLISAAGRVWK